MSKKVVIFGTGDFAAVASVYLEEDSPYEVAAFTVHRRFLDRAELLGRPVVPFEDLPATHPPGGHAMLAAVGFSKVNRARAEVFQECQAAGYEMISYVSSRAVRMGHVRVGANCFVFEHNTLQPFSSLGDNVVVWSGNHIGHHAAVGDHCFIASHVVVSGNCRVGPYCFLGVNATLRDGVTLGEACVVGAGALILKDAAPRSVFKGQATAPAEVTSDRLRL
jgi:sugar O-acyltransferase (sialic acid O-acetyltransferase NeuD family)